MRCSFVPGYEAFGAWAKKDLKAASEWLADLDDLKIQDALRPTVILQWAKDDPQAALTWTKENLDGRYRADAVAELVHGVVTSDKNVAGDLVMQIEPGPGRVRAAEIVAREWFPAMSGNSPNEKADPKAIAWLKGLDDPKAREAALGAITESWASADPESLKHFFETAEGPLASGRSLDHAAQLFTRSDPQGTLAWAEGLGPDRSPEVSEAVFSAWINNQPGIATK